MGWPDCVRFPAVAKSFSSPSRPRLPRGPHSVISNAYPELFFWEAKGLDSENDYSPHPLLVWKSVDVHLHAHYTTSSFFFYLGARTKFAFNKQVPCRKID
jgi:hypothetical protein